MKILAHLSFFLILFSCTKDRSFNVPDDTNTGVIIQAGSLKVNELCATGSTYTNELGTPTDWFEIYNPSSDTFTLSSGRWYCTDNQSMPTQYVLPEIKIAPRGFFVIQCDSRDTVANQVHTNFNLSSAGEAIGLFYRKSDGTVLQVDYRSFAAQTSGTSMGLLPDGSDNWTRCSTMTPGASNR